MLIIPLGVPGSGKGTQTELLKSKLNIPHIATGDLVRDQIKKSTPLGIRIKHYHDSGGLVPDEIIVDMLDERISQNDCAKGFILDGYPRNVTQAQNLEKIFDRLNCQIDAIVYINLDLETMLKRLRGRWTCEENGHIFHEIFSPPVSPGVCDFDGSKLYQRADQSEESIQERIKKFNTDTAPLIDYYKNIYLSQNKFFEINGDQPIETVFHDICSKLKITA